MRRGEVWTGNLYPVRGREIGKIRPVLVMQMDEVTDSTEDAVIVLPLSSKVERRFDTTSVPIRARDRLEQDSFVIVRQPRTLDRGRFGEGPLTRLSAEEMALVEEGMRMVLGL